MKHKEWKVGLSLLAIISITVFAYLDRKPQLEPEIVFYEFPHNTEEFSFEFRGELSDLQTECDFGLSSAPKSQRKLSKLSFPVPDPQADLDSGLVRIYVPGGLVSQSNQYSELMKERYNIDFYSQGCIQLYPEEYLMAYNATVFSHLDEKYGAEWREFLVVDTY